MCNGNKIPHVPSSNKINHLDKKLNALWTFKNKKVILIFLKIGKFVKSLKKTLKYIVGAYVYDSIN